jgi:hypothetical protein
MNYSVEELRNIFIEAADAAKDAATRYFNETLGGQDRYACGFAWTTIYGIKGNTKLGRAMKAAGYRKGYDGGYEIWNPSGLHCQNVDTKEVGARAAAEVFKRYGFTAYAGSRLD